VLKPGFVADNKEILASIAARTRRCVAVVGFVDSDRDLYNAAAVLADGELRVPIASACYPTTECSTKPDTSPPATRAIRSSCTSSVG